MRSPNPQGEPAPTSPPTIDLSPAEHRAVPSIAPEADPSVAATPFDELNTVPHSLTSLSTPGWSGRAFGRYEVLAEIAQGGMGVVYRVRDTLLRRVVALKMIRSGALASADEVERFFREAKAVAQLKHPHIVTIHDFGQIEGNHYFTMDLAEGGSLAAHLARFTAAPRDAVALLMKVSRAVQAVHEQALVHRDLKPANILLRNDDEPLVTDFGLAKLAEAEELTQTGAAPGTPAYMAPEQARADKAQIGPHTDVWALGVILYEVLTGRKPFPGPGREKITSDILSTDPPRPRSLQRGLDRSLETILLKCLEKDTRKRYPSAGALADDLGCWLRGEPIRARPQPWWARFRRATKRHPWRASVVIFGLLAGALAPFVVSYFDRDRILHTQIYPRLLRGESVVLVGETGPPIWSDWRIEGAADKSSPDTPFLINSGNVSLLELLREVELEKFRFRAEIRHEPRDSGHVGLYLGASKLPLRNDEGHSFCAVAFADWGHEAFSGGKSVAEVKMRLAHHYLTKGNTHAHEVDTVALPFVPLAALESKPDWRRLTIDVRPDSIEVYWDKQHKFVGRLFSLERLQRAKLMLLRNAKIQDAPPSFSPQGGLGLYVNQGWASFRNVVIEPLHD